jgi:hypothetical protein
LATRPSGSITRSQRSSTHSAAPLTRSTLPVGGFGVWLCVRGMNAETAVASAQAPAPAQPLPDERAHEPRL